MSKRKRGEEQRTSSDSAYAEMIYDLVASADTTFDVPEKHGDLTTLIDLLGEDSEEALQFKSNQTPLTASEVEQLKSGMWIGFFNDEAYLYEKHCRQEYPTVLDAFISMWTMCWQRKNRMIDLISNNMMWPIELIDRLKQLGEKYDRNVHDMARVYRDRWMREEFQRHCV